ncbi:H-NS family nucleoid-associated regulatory protein [Ralstonia nicotianae]|uniref:H-NS family nucleoid-associated regulatory protein n=1 Tax=Ralstonia pseudosolanacearum TaxID=1310165 RepID=UPI002006C053|nr:H-NS family nucleoid-associated regulatory protein [Ralstonia pseudosolanacearum]
MPSLVEPSPAVLLRRRAEAITWVRTQIAAYGLTYADLMAAGCFSHAKQDNAPIRFRNAEGQVWDGEGEMPDWLRRAVNAGQSVEHFRVSR